MADKPFNTFDALMGRLTDTADPVGRVLDPSELPRSSDFPTMGGPDAVPLADPRCAFFLPTKPMSREAEAAFRETAEEMVLAALAEDLADCIDPTPPIVDQHGRSALDPSIGILPWGGPFILAGRVDDE